MRKPTTVDAYIAAQAPSARPALKSARAAIRKALPSAEEIISYGIPAYKVHGRIALFFACWKDFYSLYPVGASVVTAFKAELAPYERKGSTLRFPYDRRVPTTLIGRIARFRARAIREPAKKKKQQSKRSA